MSCSSPKQEDHKACLQQQSDQVTGVRMGLTCLHPPTPISKPKKKQGRANVLHARCKPKVQLTTVIIMPDRNRRTPRKTILEVSKRLSISCDSLLANQPRCCPALPRFIAMNDCRLARRASSAALAAGRKTEGLAQTPASSITASRACAVRFSSSDASGLMKRSIA